MISCTGNVPVGNNKACLFLQQFLSLFFLQEEIITKSSFCHCESARYWRVIANDKIAMRIFSQIKSTIEFASDRKRCTFKLHYFRWIYVILVESNMCLCGIIIVHFSIASDEYDTLIAVIDAWKMLYERYLSVHLRSWKQSRFYVLTTASYDGEHVDRFYHHAFSPRPWHKSWME